MLCLLFFDIKYAESNNFINFSSSCYLPNYKGFVLIE